MVKFLFQVIHGQRPLEVDCDKLKTYTLNTRATTKIVKQKVIANKLTKKRKKKIIKHTELINKKTEKKIMGQIRDETNKTKTRYM